MPSIELKNMDCMEYLGSCKENTFDICITSPPYNIGSSHHTGSFRHSPYPDDTPEKQYQEQQVALLNELHRTMKKGGSLFYNHKNRIKNRIQISPYEWIFRTNWIVKQEIVWINGTPNMDKIRFFPFTERIYWLVKDDKTVCDNQAGHKDYFEPGRWGAQGTSGTHTRAFPLKMVEDILSMFPSAKKMIDPYLGSGTCAIAAHYFGCDFVGTEISPEYYKLACQRFKDETAQQLLFGDI